MTFRKICVFAITFFISTSLFAQIPLVTEKIRHKDAVDNNRGIFYPAIGDGFVVAEAGARDGYGNPDSIYPPLFVWEVNGDKTPIKAIFNQQNGSRFQGVSASGDEILARTRSFGNPTLQLYKKNQGGVNNWGFVREFGADSISKAILRGDTIAARASLNGNFTFNIYDRDQGGSENWGLSREIVIGDITSHEDFDGNTLIYTQRDDITKEQTLFINARDQGGLNNWGEVSSLTISQSAQSIAISGDTIVVGSPDGEANGKFGEVDIFQKDVGGTDNWGLLKPIQPNADGNFNIPNDRSRYGYSVDIDGDNIIVGAPGTVLRPGQLDPGVHTGRYFHFGRNQGGTNNWGQTGAFLTDSDQGDARGFSVAIKGDTFAVGIPSSSEIENGIDTDLESVASMGIGTVPNGVDDFRTYLATQTGTGFAEQIAANNEYLLLSGNLVAPFNSPAVSSVQRFTGVSSGAPRQDFAMPQKLLIQTFISDLAVSDNNWLAVGNRSARSATNNNILKGETYLYRFELSRWRFVKTLEPDVLGFSDQWFGQAVAIDDQHLAVGAPYDISAEGLPSGGAVYVYAVNQGGIENWGEVKKINIPDPTNSDEFGRAVSLSGDTIAVGVRSDDGNEGSVAIFERNLGGADNWGLSQLIKAPVPQSGERFGGSLQIIGDRVVVGGQVERAYLFERNRGGDNQWGHVQTFTDQDGINSGNLYGKTVAMSQNRIALSAENKATVANGVGVVRVYQYDPAQEIFTAVADLVASDGVQLGNLGKGDLIIDHDDIIVSHNGVEFSRFQGKAYRFNLPPSVRNISGVSSNSEQVVDGRNADTTDFKNPIKQLKVQFSQDVVVTSSPSHGFYDFDALNSDNYLLVSGGADKTFQTSDCIAGGQGDDIKLPIAAVSYDDVNFETTLNLSSGANFVSGDYRLIVCGSTSIHSYWNDKLDGDFDAVSGDDFLFDFSVTDDGFCVPIKANNGNVVLICL